MTKKKFLIAICILYCVHINFSELFSQNSLKEYLINKVLINKVDYFSKQNKMDSVLYYSNRILKSNDLTFTKGVYVNLSKLAFKNKNTEQSFKYLDEAVKIGYSWNFIDTLQRCSYGYKRFIKNWIIFKKKYHDMELTVMLNKVSETDQGIRIKYFNKKTTKAIYEEYKKTDENNCLVIKQWVQKNSWPKFLTYNDSTLSFSNINEECPITSYISHFGRENVLFFLKEAYQSASKGYSSWNLVFQLENFLLWKFPYTRAASEFNDTNYQITTAPLLRVYIDNKTNSIDYNKSLFEIISIAEIIHPNANLNALILPSPNYFKNINIGYNYLHKIHRYLEILKVNKNRLAYININSYNNYINVIKKYCDFKTPFFIVFYNKNKFSSFCLTPYGSPTIIEYSKLSEYDINSLYTSR